MGFIITSCHSTSPGHVHPGRVFWTHKGYTLQPSMAKTFPGRLEAEKFRDRRIKNGWAVKNHVDIEVRVEEIQE